MEINQFCCCVIVADKFKIVEDGLEILNVTLEDRGIYTCRAFQVTEDASMFTEKIITLNIQRKLDIIFSDIN